MSMAGHRIRIYDLAKELKLDNKRVIDDARREGIDVSVPTNTIPMEVAERIRTKYYPKKAAPAAGPRLVKTIKQVEAVEPAAVEFSPDLEEEVIESAEIEPESPADSKQEIARPKVIKLRAA